MTERPIYLELVKLGQERARDAIVSVTQLIDDPEQRIALMINVAVDIMTGAASYTHEQHPELSAEQSLYAVVGGLCFGLGEDKIDKGYQEAVAAKKREGKVKP